MGRNPLPYEQQDAKGYFQEHPSRERKPVIVSRPLGPPPKEIDDVFKKMWKTIAKQLPVGVAKFSDRLMFEALVRAAVKMRNGTARGVDIQQLVCIGSHFGLSPIARMKVGAAQESPKDDLDELLVKPKPNRPDKRPTSPPDVTVQ